MKVILNQIIKTLPSSNAAIKNTASTIEREGWYPAFSASGQDVWLPDYRFEQKGIVVSAVGARCGKAFKADGKWNVCANTHVLSVDEQQADRDYFWYLLNNENWWIKGGSAQPFVKIADSLKRSVEIPSLEEQKKRVRNLDGIRKLIDGQIEKKNLLEELVKARFVEMFGDLATNDKKWPMKNFLEFAQFDCQMTTDYEKYADYPHIGIDAIEKNTGKILSYRTVKEDGVISGKYLFSPEHIIYSKIRPNLNKVATPDFYGVCSADAYPILPRENITKKEFLAAILRSDYYLDYVSHLSTRANMPKVNRTQISGFVCPIPPIALQEDYKTFVDDIDKSKFEVQKKIDLYTELLNKKMDEYFNSEAN